MQPECVNSGFGNPSQVKMTAPPTLAESQVVSQFKEYEDPGRAWIDLVLAFKVQNREQVASMLAVAKKSNWTHEQWDEATKDDDTDEYDDDDELFAEEGAAKRQKWQEFADTQDEFYEE